MPIARDAPKPLAASGGELIAVAQCWFQGVGSVGAGGWRVSRYGVR